MPGIKLTARAAGTTVNKNALTEVNVKTAKVLTGDSKHEELTPKESVNIIIGVFFDGTGNNRYNVNARKAYEKQKNGGKLSTEEKEAAETYTRFFGLVERGGSFKNEESNISRTEPYYFKGELDSKTIQVRLYIEGIGTEDGIGDSSVGGGTGTGSTGVRAKVKKVCGLIVDEISPKIGKKYLNTLTIDSFGFSRGAAAARHFVYEITKKKGAAYSKQTSRGGRPAKYEQHYGLLGQKLANKDLIPKLLSVRHVGLFDTVAAVGLPWNHEDNMRNLHLDSITQARSVFQIAAEDEHRKNFKLTNTKSVSLKSGIEKVFPGVHSDIGGGYVDNDKENVRLTPMTGSKQMHTDERDNLINQGWYNPDQIKVINIPGYYSPTMYYLNGIRVLSNKYSYIPLHIMAKFAKEKKVEIKNSKLESKYKITGDSYLMAAKQVLTDYTFNNGEAFSYSNKKYRPLVKLLRNKYFHWSANYGSIGMGPNIENGERKRGIFDDVKTK